MNILILSWRGLNHPNAGGAEQSTFAHAKGWAKAGHKVTLFTSYYIGAKKEEEIDGVDIVRRGAQFIGVQLEAFKWYLFGSHKKFDLVVDEFHGIPFFTPLYVRTKKLAFIHEVTKEVWRLNPWPSPFNVAAFIIGSVSEPLIFKYLYFNIPFMTVSESTKKDLISWGIPEKNVNVIHNGFDKPPINKSFEKEQKKTIIFLGALSRDKGIEDALKIFSRLDRISSDWQFWVAGKGAAGYLRGLKQLAQKLDIDRKVQFWGFVSDEKKFELLSRAHVLINPSIREGWGFVVIEAASVGTPTVAYNVPGLRDSIVDGKTGILCSKNTIEDLSENVLKLLGDKKIYERMCKNAIFWSKNFSWQKASKQSIKLIESLVSKG